MSAIIIAAPGPIFIDPNQNAVHLNDTVTSDGYAIYQGIGVKEVSLIVNIKNVPTGTTPSIQYTIEEVDPGDLNTVFGPAVSTSVITGVTIETITLVTTVGGAIKVSWVLLGTTPSFTGVYTTITTKIAPADRVTAASPFSNRLSDGAAFYTAAKTGQLPTALVGGRLDTNLGAWLGSTAPTVGQKTSANSIPVVISSDQSSIAVTGTFDNDSIGVNNAAAPTHSTQIGGSDGTNLQASRVFDLDTGAGSEYNLGVVLRKPASGGSVIFGTSTDPIRIDPTGTTTQPVSGTVTANQGAGTGAAVPWSIELSDGAAFYTAAKTGQFPAALVSGRLDVNLGSWLGSTAPTVGQKTSANSIPIVIASDQSAITISGTVTANIGTTNGLALDATLTGGTQTTRITDGTNTATVKAASTAAVATDKALVVAVSPNNSVAVTGTVTSNQGTGTGAAAPWSVELSDGAAFYTGAKTGQFPAALVGGRLDTNLGSWLGSTAPTVGQKTSANSIPIVIASDQSAVAISGTVTANIGTTNGLALDATLTGGTQTTRITDGTNTATVKAASTAAVATDKALVVAVSPNNSVAVTGTVTANQGTGTGAAAPWSVELSDGAAFYTGAKTGQFPAALVSGRLDVNLGSWLGSTAPTVGQKTSVNSIPIVIASDQSAIAVTGTFDNDSVGVNNAAAPGSSTQIGGSDGTNLQASRVFDLDTGAGTEYDLGVSIRLPSSGGSVAGGTSANPIRTDPTGTTTQPVSGTVTANIGTTNGLALDATLTGGTQTTRITDGTNTATVKAASTAAVATDQALVVAVSPNNSVAVTGTITANQGTGTGAAAPWSVELSDGAAFYTGAKTGQFPAALVGGRLDVNLGTWLGSTAPTVGQKTSANSIPVVIASDQSAVTISGTVTANIGTTNGLALDATLTGGTQTTRITDGTNTATVKAASTAAVATDQALVVAVSPNNSVAVTQATAANLNAQVQGAGANGAAVTGNPVLIAGSDGTNARTIKTLTDGTIQTRYKELATFTGIASSIAIGNNKSMFSIVNASGSTVTTRISAIYVTSVQTVAVAGVIGTFELRRITNHSVGTAITAIETMHSDDSLDGSITLRTNATVTAESANLLWRSLFTTDEWAPSAAVDTAAIDHIFTTMHPIWKRNDYDNKPIILKANEGLTVKFATNSTAGTFDIMVVFTQE